jgi:hypothetical protein
MNSYWPGQGVRVKTVNKFSVSGTPTDPTVVTLLIRNPAGTVMTYTYLVDLSVIRVGAGDYYYDLVIPTTVDAEGKWNYAWRGTSACQAADEGQFEVRKSTVRSVP